MNKPRILVVLPAYNAARTLERTVKDIPPGVADEILLVDDGSHDDTVAIAGQLGLTVIKHSENRGYGANQKTCYGYALKSGAEVIIMLHPDYQYDARIIPAALEIIKLGICDVVLGSRIRTRRETLEGGMPVYKYIANRLLTILANLLLGQNLGDFHTGFRVYRRRVLETVPFEGNSDGFIFDSQFLVQSVYLGFRLGDVPISVRYLTDSSSIGFKEGLKYSGGTLKVFAQFCVQRLQLCHLPLFIPKIKP